MGKAGIRVSPGALYSIRHKDKHEYAQDVRDFYRIFFLCDQWDDSRPKCGGETIDVDFFAVDDLPPLPKGRVVEVDIQLAFSFKRPGTSNVFFD